jgi:hypothetical protein
MATHGGPRYGQHWQDRRHWQDLLNRLVSNPWIFLAIAVVLAFVFHFVWQGVTELL